MGCGASVERNSAILEGAEAEIPPDTGEEVPEEGKVPLTSRPAGWELKPKPVLAQEVLNALDPVNNPPQITPATKPPLKAGIWVKPSPRCIMPVIFHFEDPDPDVKTVVEMKEFDSPDDVFKNWTCDEPDDGREVALSEIEGVVGLYPIAPGTVLSGLAPNRYMYRWNDGGTRTCGPRENLNLIVKITEYLTSFMEEAQELAKKTAEEMMEKAKARAAEMKAQAAAKAAEMKEKGEAAGEAANEAADGAEKPDGGVVMDAKARAEAEMAKYGITPPPMPSQEEIEAIIKKVLKKFQELLIKQKEKIKNMVNDAGEAMPDLIPDDHYIFGDISDALQKFKDDLVAWTQVKTPRELPDWLGPIKTLFIEFEDNYIYNLIEVKCEVDMNLGYFEWKNDQWNVSHSFKEKAIAYVLDQAEEKAKSGLQMIKDKSKGLMQKVSDKLGDQLSIDLASMAPTMMPQINEKIETMSMSMKGLTKKIEADPKFSWAIDKPSQRGWMLSDRDETERIKRIEDTYYTAACLPPGSGVSRVAHVVPEYFYEVEIYIVWKPGKKARTDFKRAYINVWQESSDVTAARKMLMTPYFQGTKPEGDEENGDGGEDEEECEDEEEEEEEEEEEGEEEEEEGEDGELEYMFRGFQVTVPVLAGRNYCYSIIIDNKVYTSPDKARKKKNKFCKKFKVEVGCAAWGVNPLRELGLI